MREWLRRNGWIAAALLAAAIELTSFAGFSGYLVGGQGVQYCEEGERPGDAKEGEQVPPATPLCRVGLLHFYHDAIELSSVFFTAAFTGVLAWSTIRLWEATRDTAKIAERSLTDLERPYLFIVNLRPIAADGGINAHQARVLYDVANYGKTPAIIDHIETGYFRTADTVEGFNPEKPGHPLFSAHAISPGQVIKDIQLDSRARVPLIALIDVVTDETYHLPQFFSTTEDLVVRVFIRYDGPASKGHETMSYWRWDDTSKSFARHGGEDENYTK